MIQGAKVLPADHRKTIYGGSSHSIFELMPYQYVPNHQMLASPVRTEILKPDALFSELFLEAGDDQVEAELELRVVIYYL